MLKFAVIRGRRQARQKETWGRERDRAVKQRDREQDRGRERETYLLKFAVISAARAFIGATYTILNASAGKTMM